MAFGFNGDRSKADIDGLISSAVNALRDTLTGLINGKADSSHEHAASDITEGTLPVGRGGTGVTSLQALRSAAGLGNTTGAVPIANGGTGATTAAAALQNLGIGGGGACWTRLWSGSCAKGNSITVTNLNKYRLLGCRVSESASGAIHGILLIGAVNVPNSVSQLHCSGMYDTGTATWGDLASFTVSGNTLTLTAASSHRMDSGTVDRGLVVREVWGLI